jgi:hypothetical protein
VEEVQEQGGSGAVLRRARGFGQAGHHRIGSAHATTQTLAGTAKPPPADLVGTWRRFGAFGPVYEIIGTGGEPPGDDPPGGDRLMRVRVAETGEELDYRLAEILDDPRER